MTSFSDLVLKEEYIETGMETSLIFFIKRLIKQFYRLAKGAFNSGFSNLIELSFFHSFFHNQYFGFLNKLK